VSAGIAHLRQKQNAAHSTFSILFSIPIFFHRANTVCCWKVAAFLTNLFGTCASLLFKLNFFIYFLLMKRIFLLLPRLAFLIAFVAMISLALATTATAQANASTASEPPISTEDLQQESDWKSPVDYSAVVASERATAGQVLASPTTKELDFALYTAYDRMLAYMEADMIAGVPIEKVAENNFFKVTEEAASDPTLTNLEMAAFNSLYASLVVMLHQ